MSGCKDHNSRKIAEIGVELVCHNHSEVSRSVINIKVLGFGLKVGISRWLSLNHEYR